MKDIADQLREQLGEDMGSTSASSLIAQARAEADKKITRRRIGIGGGATALAAAATAMALTLGAGAPTTASGGQVVTPAGRGTAAATTSTSSPTTKAVASTSTTPAAAKTSAATLAPDHGYYPHPEVMKPGEAVLWDASPEPYVPGSKQYRTFFADAPGHKDIPRVFPNPAGTPYADMRLTMAFGASTGSPAGVEAGCDPAYGGGKLDSLAGRQGSYWHRTAFGASDGNHDPAVDRSAIYFNIAEFADGTVNLPQAFLARKMTCVPKWDAAPVVDPTWTVPGATHAWLARPAAPEPLYGYRRTFAMVQKGPYLISVSSEAKTQATADAQATWFITQALANVPAGVA